MNNNGKSIDVIRVTLTNGKFNVIFGVNNMERIGYAVRLASLQLDNAIIAKQAESASEGIVVPPGLIR